jgi:hypothetical protein
MSFTRSEIMGKKIYETRTIHLTTDYGSIEFMDTINRKVNTTNTINIMKSIEKKNLTALNPIIVFRNPKKRGKFLVIDGQHRLTALKELGLPVYYVIDETIKTLKQAGDAILLLNNNGKSYTAGETLKTRLDLGCGILKKMEEVLKDAGLEKIGIALGASLLYQFQVGGSLNRALTSNVVRIRYEDSVRELGGYLATIDFKRKYALGFVMFVVRAMKFTDDKRGRKRIIRQIREIEWSDTGRRLNNTKGYTEYFLEQTGIDLR